ncbi:hypothetical protein AA0472_1852 [Acetobacter estunensis NRIC 0472]|uniref:Uncharacterized protein n=1 Tax=Acetobacter estunensis TaxID=104097 RepID=A0A967BB82_9PROT|nr:hypothetical protein [Acetobacter estunensis]NHO55366.1 hypothetical protein [Acetobacter estunensis]GBQ25702.1 hypothetical protein AA0472_1852 [Acetobacter estunensis NRIC 0472]
MDSASSFPEDEISRQFSKRVSELRESAEEWIGRPVEPEQKLLRDMIFLMVALGDQCHGARAALRETAAQCRKDTTEEIRESRKLIGEGVKAVETLKQVNEKTVDAHLAKLLIRIGRDISDSVQKSVDLGNKRAALEIHFRTVLYGSIIFCLGFVFGHVM